MKSPDFSQYFQSAKVMQAKQRALKTGKQFTYQFSGTQATFVCCQFLYVSVRGSLFSLLFKRGGGVSNCMAKLANTG